MLAAALHSVAMPQRLHIEDGHHLFTEPSIELMKLSNRTPRSRYRRVHLLDHIAFGAVNSGRKTRIFYRQPMVGANFVAPQLSG